MFFKDEAIILRKSIIWEKDISITVYMKKRGKENIYIQNGALLKSPYISITEPFNIFKGVFYIKKDSVFIQEVERYKNLAILMAKDIEIFKTGFEIVNIFNRYIIYQDEKIYILLKKTFYYLALSKNPKMIKLAFLIKLVYLSGIFPNNLKNLNWNYVLKIKNSPFKELENFNIPNINQYIKTFENYLSEYYSSS